MKVSVWFTSGSALLLMGLTGCSVAGAAAGAVISVGGAVVSTGITLTGKAVGAGIDAMTSPSERPDNSGIIIRERISPAPTRCQPASGDATAQPCD
ncbi:hypothetical protein [Ottowia caeni]|uniref:hypothetical protein n=1 Tax=Ottowia caeni TaxID=2870339 RepID=UPI001E5C0C44|nr:hypothetical protein [Ottowia caeni]